MTKINLPHSPSGSYNVRFIQGDEEVYVAAVADDDRSMNNVFVDIFDNRKTFIDEIGSLQVSLTLEKVISGSSRIWRARAVLPGFEDYPKGTLEDPNWGLATARLAMDANNTVALVRTHETLYV